MCHVFRPGLIALVLCLLFSGIGEAGDAALYTWKDVQGNLHITDRPPPADATVIEVTRYQPDGGAAVGTDQGPMVSDILEQAASERTRANVTRSLEQAETSKDRAEELRQLSREYREKAEALYQTSGSPFRRKRSQQRAQRMNELADQAAAIAREAEQQGYDIESSVRDILENTDESQLDFTAE